MSRSHRSQISSAAVTWTISASSSPRIMPATMPLPDVPGTKDRFRQVVLGTRTAFPDVHVEISGLIEQDDMIAFHELATATGTGAQQHPAEPGAPVANGDPVAEIRRWRDHQALVQHRPARHDAATGCHPQ